MSYKVAIRVDGLGKQYRIGAQPVRYRTLRDQIAALASSPFRRLASALRGHSAHAPRETIWALRDVSFEVPQGQVLGVIGKNGAGKTTLLKLLSRITEPTEGRAEIHGRVGSLLEVGTGFHPELTGRENVFLNGAILGMSRREIEEKFDRIVEFSEIGAFLDTPVKHYSSGMQVRLAFAVAAHLEPEVLLIDEVLAVGDAGFQKKCIRSIRDTTSSGHTVLVVSHNLGFVRSLCNRVLLLSDGRIAADGEPEDIVRLYHESFRSEAAVFEGESQPDRATDLWVQRAAIKNRAEQVSAEIPCGQGFRVELDLDLRPGFQSERLWLGIRIHSWQGDLVAHLANREAGFELPAIDTATRIHCEIPAANLLPGEYVLGVVVADINHRVYDRIEQILSLSITSADVFGSGMLLTSKHGLVYLDTQWDIESLFVSA